jgi:Zn-finger nucleic acid-binding protein
MICPKCESEMESVKFAEVEVERCTGCAGMWFDVGQRERLEQLRGSESIDLGEAGRSRRHEETGRIPCPRCRGQMVRMVDKKHPNVWYEQCSVCNGTYFDAGEFRDLKERSILDVFRDLFTRPRD